MATNWTQDQKNAIEDRGGTLLLSAAAGSGKTAVLVERVIKKLTDPINPIDATELLIVTFSNAAAAEMRARIFKKLSEMSVNSENRSRLARQMMLLDTANISTIHAFCIKLLRRNFNILDLSPTFDIADENEISVLKNIAINKVITEYYKKNDPCFISLVELLSTFRDDNNLVATVLKLYDSVRAYPFFKSWLKEKLNEYHRAKEDVKNSPWANVIFTYSSDALNHARNAMLDAISKMSECDLINEKYLPVFLNDLSTCESALKCVESRDLDGLFKAINSHVYDRLPAIRNCEDKPLQEYVKAQRELLKDIFSDVLKYVCTDEETFKNDILLLIPKIEMLFDLTISFSDKIDELKKDRNILDFSDVEQLTLQLLVTPTENGYEPTEIAKDLRDEFSEILIDEYQDTNAAQDLIFSSISKDGKNLFMVGDVKQSIYQFRQAMPQLFIKKQEEYSSYDGENYPALIRLSKNFRSRFEVTSAINFFFSALMSKNFGQVDYNDGEALVCGASYPECDLMKTEVDIVLQTEELSSLKAQAIHIAKRIHEMKINGKVTDKTTGELRSPRFSDFAILMRATKGSANIFVEELSKMGIPAYFNNSESCLNSVETMLLLSLIRVISNPTFDVDLVTVLYSFLYNFTSDDMAKIRLVDRKASLYSNMLVLAEDEESDIREKCKNFVDDIADYRLKSAQMRIYELIQYIYDKTDYPSMVAAKYNDDVKVSNLYVIKNFAVSFQKRPVPSLSSFIRYIDRIIESGGDLPGANLASDSASSVQIMSIHRSKGLEFPICFVADLSRQFNKRDIRESAVLHSELGFACVRRDEKLHAQYNTVPLTATRLKIDETSLSEELRMLYVALTRAKEKLILIIPSKNPDKLIPSILSKNPQALTTPYILKNCSSFSQWILLCLLRHPCSNVLEGADLIEKFPNATADFSLTVYGQDQSEEESENEEYEVHKEYNEDIKRYMLESYSYVYPYEASTKIFAKASVTDLSEKEFLMPMLKPQFKKSEVLSAAKKGTALHKVMQYADYIKAVSDAAGELERLKNEGFISEIEFKNIDISVVKAFFNSPLAKRILSADFVRREMKFTLLLDATELDKDAHKDDNMILQGIADCVFKEGNSIVVLDFKSDKVNSADELIMRYSGQLKLYKKAILEMFGVSEVKRLIYSFALGETIELD